MRRRGLHIDADAYWEQARKVGTDEVGAKVETLVSTVFCASA